jgi:hypothetical protein
VEVSFQSVGIFFDHIKETHEKVNPRCGRRRPVTQRMLDYIDKFKPISPSGNIPSHTGK